MTYLLPPLDPEVTGPSTPLVEPLTNDRPGQPYAGEASSSSSPPGDLPQNRETMGTAGVGKTKDRGAYVRTANVQRPWLAIPGVRRFVWPVGVEGFNISLRPDLSIHKYLGDNRVEIDVMHVGEKRIQLSGVFLGKTAAATMRALSDICERPSPDRGKILHLPLVLPKYQYVFVEDAEFDRSNEIIGDTRITYRVTFVRASTAPAKKVNNPSDSVSTITPSLLDRGDSGRVFRTTDTINTARKVALTVYGSEDQWATLAQINAAAIAQANIPLALVPDYRMRPGTEVHY